jgi:hypothetical protein
MSPVRRRLRILAATASVTCLLTTLALWAFCHLASGRTAIGVGLGWRWIGNESYPICGVYLHDPSDNEHELWHLRTALPPYISNPRVVLSHQPLQFLGFQYIEYRATPTDRYIAIGIPFWFLTLLSALASYRYTLPLLKRHPSGRCPHCGYDLRATPDRCPECGLAATTIP